MMIDNVSADERRRQAIAVGMHLLRTYGVPAPLMTPELIRKACDDLLINRSCPESATLVRDRLLLYCEMSLDPACADIVRSYLIKK